MRSPRDLLQKYQNITNSKVMDNSFIGHSKVLSAI